jgi:hypothetical protein
MTSLGSKPLVVTNAEFSPPLRAIVEEQYTLAVCPNFDPAEAGLAPEVAASIHGILLYARHTKVPTPPTPPHTATIVPPVHSSVHALLSASLFLMRVLCTSAHRPLSLGLGLGRCLWLPQLDAAAVRERFPALKVIANVGVGVDHIDIPQCEALGIRVGNTPGVTAAATADVAMGLLLATARNIVVGDKLARSPGFAKIDPYW